MNILFVLYGDFSCNSANPLVLYARELHLAGHSCAVAVPSKLETVTQHPNPSFRPLLTVMCWPSLNLPFLTGVQQMLFMLGPHVKSFGTL